MDKYLKPKLIILEGLDRVGKTTLIKELRKTISNPKVMSLSSASPPKCVDEPGWTPTHYWALMMEVSDLVSEGWTIIMDRFHIGETVYGPIYRNSETDYIWQYEETLLAHDKDVWLITLVDNGESIIARDDGGSHEKDAEAYDRTRMAFEASHAKSKIANKLLINITNNGWVNPDAILEMIYD